MNKVYLLDTNIASALFDADCPDHQYAKEFIKKAKGNLIYISRIVVAEIQYGLSLYSNLDEARKNKVLDALKVFPGVAEINDETTPHYAGLRARLYRKFGKKKVTENGVETEKIKQVRPESLVDETTSQNLGIQENDLWMAAIALQRKMTLVSGDKMNNIKTVCPELNLQTWKPHPLPIK